MKFVKNYFVVFFMMAMLATILTACGSNTDNNTSNALYFCPAWRFRYAFVLP